MLPTGVLSACLRSSAHVSGKDPGCETMLRPAGLLRLTGYVQVLDTLPGVLY
jgi:hypothetical protein